MEYLHDEIELADIQNVESMLESKIAYMESNGYDFAEIREIKKALNIVRDLTYDL